MSQVHTRSKRSSEKERNSAATETTDSQQKKPPTGQNGGGVDNMEEMLQQIRSIVKKEITEQVGELKRTVTKQLEDIRTEFNKKIADIEESVQYAHASVAESKSDMDRKVQRNKEELGDLIQTLEEKCNALERHSRAYNLRIIGVPEEPQENCLEKVIRIMDDLDFYESSAEIENTHRTGKKNPTRPRQIIIKFYSRPFRNRVLFAAKRMREADSSFTAKIVEDFTHTDYMKRKRAIPKMTQAVREGARATFRNGNLIINGKIVSV